MKAIIRRCTLALIMCGVCAAGMAQTVILDENFTDGNSGYSITIPDWDLLYCCKRDVGIWTASVLSIETDSSDKTKKGHATTPTLNYIGEATLSFKLAATTKNSTCTISIVVTNGTIDGTSSKDVSATVQTLREQTFNLSLSNDAKIKFSLKSDTYAAIDDVKIISTDGITLLEGFDNSETITVYTGESKQVTIRPLTGSIWNTLCLPFDVNMAAMEAALGENQDIKLRTYDSFNVTNNVMNFTPVTDNTVIPAGTPFLVWLNTTVNSPKFDWVTVKNTDEQTITSNGVSFVGTYNPTYLNTDGTHLFLTTSNTLAIPGAGKNQIKGMRAYISLSSSESMSPARIAFIDEQPTAIETVESVGLQPVPATYSLCGQRVAQPNKGLYIVNGKLTLIK